LTKSDKVDLTERRNLVRVANSTSSARRAFQSLITRLLKKLLWHLK